MKRWVWVASLLVLTSLSIAFALFEWHAQQASSAPHLCPVGTFNLHNFSAKDIQRAKKIAGLIETHNLQVVALQEVGSEKGLKLLTKYLNNKYDYIIPPQTNNQRLAILFRRGKVKVTYKGTITLSDKAHSRQRNALVVYGKVLPGGFDFFLVDVHLDANERQWRNWQLTQLHDWVFNKLSEGGEHDIILAGDFNDPLLLDDDAFGELDRGMGLYITAWDSKDLNSKFCDKTYDSPVDFIIITPDCRAEYIDNTTAFYDYANEDVKNATSDHHLSWATFNSDDLDSLTPSPLDTSPSAIIIKMPKSVQRGHKIAVQAQTFPNATCTIHVLYPSGKPPNSLQSRSRTAKNGVVTWEWAIGGSTTPGVATVQVEAQWKWGHALATKLFQITPAKTSTTGLNTGL